MIPALVRADAREGSGNNEISTTYVALPRRVDASYYESYNVDRLQGCIHNGEGHMGQKFDIAVSGWKETLHRLPLLSIICSEFEHSLVRWKIEPSFLESLPISPAPTQVLT